MTEKLKVLVVDDQKTFREAVAFEFEMLNYEPIMAENGQDAFEKYNSNKIDLIICDIRMPIWDGRKFLNELRKVAKMGPPFIFMTGFADLQPCQAFHEGADAFIGKPIDPETLAQTVERVMLPLSEQLKEKSTMVPGINITAEIDSTEQFQLGRLGFFLSTKANENISNLKVQDLIEFDITNKTSSLNKIEGRGLVVWARFEGVDESEPGVGVQIETLSDGCRQSFIDYVNKQTTAIVIPDGNQELPTEAA